MTEDSALDVKIRAFANAHRRAIDEGDKQLPPIERAILLALVARSTVDTLSWVRTRVTDGDRHSLLLVDLAAELEAKDRVGKGLQAAEKQLTANAKQLVKVAVGTAAAPVWWTASLAFLAGVVGFLIRIGNAIGGVIALLTFALAAFVALCPPFRMAILRALGKAPQAATELGQATKEMVHSTILLFSLPTTIGSQAETLFKSSATTDSDALRGASYIPRESKLVLGPIRAMTGAVVGLSLVALLFAMIVLIAGINHGFLQQVKTCNQQYGAGSDCGFGR